MSSANLEQMPPLPARTPSFGEGAAAPVQDTELLNRLSSICQGRGAEKLAQRLAEIAVLAGDDMRSLELELAHVTGEADVVEQSAQHLLALGGKRLRPLCVAIAARLGTGFGPAARELAVAVELVHSATLLHDDVVDFGAQRRGQPTARLIYGNAASIFAGDFLLVDALRRVQRAGIPGLLDELLAIIDEMIHAEAIQLEHRGRLAADRRTYFQVAEGKTASLFRFAMYAGARAGGLDETTARLLAQYGRHLGVAFQAVDDALDYTGDSLLTGKSLFGDIREGMMTYPLIMGLERDPTLRAQLEAFIALPEGEASPELCSAVTAALVSSGAIEATYALAAEHAARALGTLSNLPASRARRALETVVEATLQRVA